MTTTEALKKMLEVTKMLEAAQVLERNGLLGSRDAASVVREYVLANPDINRAIQDSST